MRSTAVALQRVVQDAARNGVSRERSDQAALISSTLAQMMEIGTAAAGQQEVRRWFCV